MSDTAQRTEFVLADPIKAHGEEIETLQLREPTAGDLVAAGGDPFVITNMDKLEEGAAPEFKWDNNVVCNLLSRLADVPRSTILAMTGGDLYRLKFQMTGLFFTQMQRGKDREDAREERRKARNTASEIVANGSVIVSTLPGSGDAIRRVSLA